MQAQLFIFCWTVLNHGFKPCSPVSHNHDKSDCVMYLKLYYCCIYLILHIKYLLNSKISITSAFEQNTVTLIKQETSRVIQFDGKVLHFCDEWTLKIVAFFKRVALICWELLYYPHSNIWTSFTYILKPRAWYLWLLDNEHRIEFQSLNYVWEAFGINFGTKLWLFVCLFVKSDHKFS